MNSLLIVSEDKAKRESHALAICEEQGIGEIDRTSISRETGEKKDTKKLSQSIGIEQIKQMQHMLYLKPIRSPMKAIIVYDAHLMTTEAQNALLKVLEEPPAQTVLMLTSESRDSLLPTILSRCSIVELGVQKSLTDQERIDYGQMLTLLQQVSINDSLKLAESLSKNKEETLRWLEKMILLAREKMQEEHTYANLIRHLQKTHTLLKTTNVNPRFTLEVLFLSIQI